MTRLGPLTAQALGRSPYDDVVEGEGEEDPRVPAQQYDSRGRPVNPDTKRLNREMIRAHNEVMQVIGVAEPENTNYIAEFDRLRRYFEAEEETGHRLLRVGRILEVAGVWGINGLRSRILLYKRYADISFFDLWKYERSQRSLSSMYLTGLPTFLGGLAVRLASYYWVPMRRHKRLLGPFLSYIRGHVQLYVFMQRADLIPANRWFPSWRYFVPGSPSSLIPAPPPPSDFSPRSLLRYVGAWGANALPFAAFVLGGWLWRRLTTILWQKFYSWLPNTVHHKRLVPNPPPRSALPDVPVASMDAGLFGQQVEDELSGYHHPPETESAVSAGADLAADVGGNTTMDIDTEEPARQPVDLPPQNRSEVLRDIDAQLASDNAPAAQAYRRPSGFSNRGDDLASDEEDEGGPSATLISFDVEATESTDAPAGGLWSAELRPSAGPDGSPSGFPAPSPTYMDTMLTRLPACLASDIFTVITAYLILSPYEAMALRLVTRSYLERRGLPLLDIYVPNIFTELSLSAVTNLIGLEFIRLVIAGEMWAFVSSLAALAHMTEEEWREQEEDAALPAAETDERPVIE